MYTMHRDHRFEMGPAAMSGPTIEGCWREDPSASSGYVVLGRWGWMNGASRADDYRRLRYSLQPPHRPATLTREHGGPVHQTFFVIQELTPVSEEEHDAACSER